jgi:hypothetical protein
MPRSASNSSTSRDEIAYRSYQRTATTITSRGNPIPRQDENSVSGDWTRGSAAAVRCERSLASPSKLGCSSSAAAWPSSRSCARASSTITAGAPTPSSSTPSRSAWPRCHHRHVHRLLTAGLPGAVVPPLRSSLCLALPPLPAQQPRKIASRGSRTASPPPHADHCKATHPIVVDLIHRFAAPLTSAPRGRSRRNNACV